MRRTVLPAALIALAALLLAACAPTAATVAAPDKCLTEPVPTVAVVDFQNTTSQGGGVNVVGVEDAATARLITLLKESGCYVIVERSELLTIMQQQGLESLDPVSLAKAAGAGYVVTGTVTRATIARPGASLFGVSVGATRAEVEVDVRATDIITGEVVVSHKGRGDASNPNLALNRLPVGGSIQFNDPTVGPLFADAANLAINDVVNALRSSF